jgi:hypothetical protein
VIAAARRDPMEPVTGDAPQPGETPGTERNPWSFDPDAAWWRGDDDREPAEALAEGATRPRNPRRRTAPGAATPASGGDEGGDEGGDGPVFAEEAVDAHAAGAQDAAAALSTGAEPPSEDAAEVTGQPESDQNRPTVSLERDAVPDQTSMPARRSDRLGRAQISPAELNVKRSRMENSPFWLNDEHRAPAGNSWPEPELMSRLADTPVDERRGRPPRHRARTPRAAAPGLFGLIALALIATFFSWVSAEPFWLAAGHGDRGIATVTRCTGSGLTQRCVGSFVATDGSFRSGPVGLLGVPANGSTPGHVTLARVVNPTSKQAYAGSTDTLLQLRWVLGFLLVLLSGLGIAGLTGTRRLETIRARRAALLMSFAGPLLLLAGFLYATF